MQRCAFFGIHDYIQREGSLYPGTSRTHTPGVTNREKRVCYMNRATEKEKKKETLKNGKVSGRHPKKAPGQEL